MESKKFLSPQLEEPSTLGLSEGKKFAMKYRSYRKGQTPARPALKVSDANEESKN